MALALSFLLSTVKSLMYGFGDDRNPATDSVNVMEEILVEYIADVVRSFRVILCRRVVLSFCAVPNGWFFITEDTSLHRGPPQVSFTAGRCKETCEDGGTAVHARGYQAGSGTVLRTGYP